MNGALALAAFNLICTGTLTSKSVNDQAVKPYSIEYRVNLDEGLWCDGECKVIKQIFEVQPTQLTLMDYRGLGPLGRQWTNVTVNRETGKHAAIESFEQGTPYVSLSKWDGTCERKAFSGFPDFKTKF